MKKLLKSLLSLMMIVSSLYPITISAVNNVLEGAGTSEKPLNDCGCRRFCVNGISN